MRPGRWLPSIPSSPGVFGKPEAPSRYDGFLRILYIQASVLPPPVNRQIDRFFLLSEALGLWRRLAIFWFYLRKGLELDHQHRYQCVVVYSHMTTALIAGTLKLLTRARLIVEIVTAPHLAYLTESANPPLKKRLMHVYSDVCLHLAMLMATPAHFLFPHQLAAYPMLRRTRNSVFHEFVPISIIDRHTGSATTEPCILLVGAPWYLKEADLLVEAFLRIAPDFPHLKLKIPGHYPDRGELDRLIGGSLPIQIVRALPHPETMSMIKQAQIMVLPSRCEGLARVLMEGMAAGLPLIASDVGGIPFLVRSGENGYLFPKGDARAGNPPPGIAERSRTAPHHGRPRHGRPRLAASPHRTDGKRLRAVLCTNAPGRHR